MSGDLSETRFRWLTTPTSSPRAIEPIRRIAARRDKKTMRMRAPTRMARRRGRKVRLHYGIFIITDYNNFSPWKITMSVIEPISPEALSAEPKRVVPYKWELLALLWLAYFFNRADKQLYNCVIPDIGNDLHLT